MGIECYRCETEVARENLNDSLLYDGEVRNLCDSCWLATRIMQLTRSKPPYVDVGLYHEVAFYARQLAAITIDDDPENAVVSPQESDDVDVDDSEKSA